MKHARGFTLVELIVVMVVAGILAGGMAIFFVPVINNYLAVGRRAGLTDMADGVLRTISRDIRGAVPNSIRQPNTSCFELVPTAAGGRFRTAPDTVWDGGAGAANPSQPLSNVAPTTAFDVMTQLSYVPVPGDWVVVNNQNGDDVYDGVNRAPIVGIAAPPDASLGWRRITLAPFQFPLGYEGGRFQIVRNAQQAVFHVCANANEVNGTGTGTLYRFSPYPFNGNAANCPVPNAATAVLATHVSQCSFIYNPNPGAAQDAGYVQVQITLKEKDESVQLQFGTHADNVP